MGEGAQGRDMSYPPIPPMIIRSIDGYQEYGYEEETYTLSQAYKRAFNLKETEIMNMKYPSLVLL